jgi:hypothetical protein
LDKRQIKIGVRQGSGPPPGYKWTVAILDFAFDEVMAFLTEIEYEHIAMQFKELAGEEDPTHSLMASVTQIDDYFELRDKGGVLGKKNIRIFFGVDKTSRSVVVLGGIKKENNGKTPDGVKITIRRRWRKFRSGDYGELIL